ncbi:LacI family DNA-binding transcriptional regulator [uncultured Ruegeria sp.]|uniref:LacI family DNA-binding transcriptional regulator n=1 Tax=uncultured Ruegeria sp. TaxID=259304 RepID=UPI0026114054|nr:LacI family DNA-binding transcriptional regulator [uncultured Ruegeria sp.]
MTRRPTIIDVAKQAGVSKSTVARVMSGGQHVSARVVELVESAAKEIGYQKNNLAVSMRSGRSGLIGIVVPDISNPFWAEVARGAQDAAASTNSSLLIFSSDWKSERERKHLQALVNTRVDGFVLNRISDSSDGRDLELLGAPSLLLGTTADLFPEKSSVGSDITQGVGVALDYLTAHGHELPKLILGSERRLARAKFITAVNEYYINRDVDPTRIPTEDGAYTVDGGRAAMARLLKTHAGGHLTIFAANDLMALGAILEARSQGLNCPRDVSVMGFDGIPAGEFCDPPLTTVGKPAKEIGRQSILSLQRLIDGDAAVAKLRLACELVERGSVLNLNPEIALAQTG